MIKLNFLHVCESVIRGQDERFSIINIFNKIQAKGPMVMPYFSIISNISGDVGEYEQNIDIIFLGREEKKIVSAKGVSKIIEPESENNFVASFYNIPFNESGKYCIKVSIDNKEFYKKYIDVDISK